MSTESKEKVEGGAEVLEARPPSESGRQALKGARRGKPQRATRLSEALPVTTLINVKGIRCKLHELTLNDLALLESAGGGIDSIRASSPQAILEVLWVLLRQHDPELTPEQVGCIFTARDLMAVGSGGLVDRLLVIAGLMEQEPDPNAVTATAPPTGS
ncbi:MAG TPA: hypothetical protein VGN26_12410 [Armatimonadota bacterium]|jgi:hypothetical protein